MLVVSTHVDSKCKSNPRDNIKNNDSKWIIGEVVPDEPTYVATLKQRHEFVTNRLFNALEADEDDHLEEDIEEQYECFPQSQPRS